MAGDLLRIEGEVDAPGALTFGNLMALPEQIADVGTHVPGRKGGAVPLAALLARARVRPAAHYLTVVARDGFSASVPLEAVAGAVVAYRLGDAVLPGAQGGPVRFLVPDVNACAQGTIDNCTNVKDVVCLRVTLGPETDARPRSPAAHDDLHRR